LERLDFLGVQSRSMCSLWKLECSNSAVDFRLSSENVPFICIVQSRKATIAQSRNLASTKSSRNLTTKTLHNHARQPLRNHAGNHCAITQPYKHKVITQPSNKNISQSRNICRQGRGGGGQVIQGRRGVYPPPLGKKLSIKNAIKDEFTDRKCGG
jgi:hypothetical protein